MSDASQIVAAASPLERWAARGANYRRPILLIASAAQALILLAMIAQQAWPLWFGRTICLRVTPACAREMLHTDCVPLRYEFSRLGTNDIDGQRLPTDDPRKWPGRTVYACLTPEPQGPYWQLARLTFQRPSEGVYLCGQTAGYDQLEFGIEAYYRTQRQGRSFVDRLYKGNLQAEVAVSPDGRAQLGRLIAR